MSLKEIERIYVSEDALNRFSEFEKLYIDIRKKEQRILSIHEIRNLPYANRKSPHYCEWRLRRKSIDRFIHYLDKKEGTLRILDIGCGNGFFAHIMSKRNHELVGVDVSLNELKQASLAFQSVNLKWYCLDIMNEPLPEEKFDIITFNASFQYFKNPLDIINVCKGYLSRHGEIHIMDSPFYSKEEITAAKGRSDLYYENMTSRQMSKYYFHHDIDELNKFNVQVMYDPNHWVYSWRKTFESPFHWIRII